jgi:hypothetical protein
MAEGKASLGAWGASALQLQLITATPAHSRAAVHVGSCGVALGWLVRAAHVLSSMPGGDIDSSTFVSKAVLPASRATKCR